MRLAFVAIFLLSVPGASQIRTRDLPSQYVNQPGVDQSRVNQASNEPLSSEAPEMEGRSVVARTPWVKYSKDFDWMRIPSTDLSSPGAKTVPLDSCPEGVFGTWPGPAYLSDPGMFYVRIDGTGNPETVQVTGGTCGGDGRAGTLQFSTANSHFAGYRVSSATAGIYEASIAAGSTIVSGANYSYKQQGGKIVVEPGLHDLWAPLWLIVSHQTIDMTGSVLKCNFDLDCLNIGRNDNYGAVNDVTVIQPRMMPTVVGSTRSMIVVYGQKTRLYNVTSMIGPSQGKGNFGNWGHWVTVVSDQAFLLDGLDTTSNNNSLSCTESFCPSVIYAPGPFSGHATWGTGKGGDNAAVGWLKHLQIAPQCRGNGIDWQSGNVLRISDSVIQGYSQFGIRTGLPKGGYGMTTLDNVYEEGGCKNNPVGNVGYAGIILQGGRLSIHGGEIPSGHYPSFAHTGDKSYYYYIVARDRAHRPSNLLYAGSANANDDRNVSVTFNDIPSATTFDLLRTTAMYQAPYGNGKWAVATEVARTAACANGLCTIADTQGEPTEYAVSSLPPAFFPALPLWPGALVIGPSKAGTSAPANGSVSLDFNDLNSIAIWQTNTLGMLADAIDSTRCILIAGSPIWQACTGQDQDLAATIMHTKTNQDGSLAAYKNLKGRINLTSSGSGPSHFVTLADSNIGKTIGAAGNRPSNDTLDTFIGYDQGGGPTIGLSFGAPVSISNYIGNVGDGRNWKERLTKDKKLFAVPVDIQTGSTLTVGSGTALSQIRLFKTADVASVSVPGQSCIDIAATVAGLTETDQISSLRPPTPIGNLSINAYAKTDNMLLLHFCNPTPSAVQTPKGIFTFLALH